MEEFTNSATRLHSILVAIRNECQKGKRIREVLARVFAVDPGDEVTLRRRLISIDDLFIDTERIISALPGVQPERYTRHFLTSRNGLVSTALDQDSQDFTPFQNALADLVLQSVEYCALRISEEVREGSIPAEDLAELESKLREVFELTLEAELEAEVREMILDIVEILRSALVEYRIRGAGGVAAAVETSVGKLSVYFMRRRKQGGAFDEKRLGTVLDLIIKFEAVLAKAKGYLPALAEYLPRLLGP